jgi:hypothetical protein
VGSQSRHRLLERDVVDLQQARVAHPEAEDEPPARRGLHSLGLRGQHPRMARLHDHHRRAQRHTRHLPRDRREDRERLLVVALREPRRPHAGRRDLPRPGHQLVDNVPAGRMRQAGGDVHSDMDHGTERATAVGAQPGVQW